ncbi:MAG: hypothetical protein L6R36_005949 [Xanthoria steineri]|nr:MAG: hypothetical protein L6R36_005949 [Xanthoria steineri]
MHLLPATHRLSATGFFFLAVSLVLETVVALDPKFHDLFKRQGCNNIESKCLTVGSDPSECIDYICTSCTQVDPSISRCCQRSGDLNKANCISENLPDSNGGGGDTSSRSRTTASSGSTRTRNTSSSPTTTFPAAANRGCSSFLDKLTSCESATPGFDDIRLWRSQASCFCYSASAYEPQAFDTPYSSCLSYLETADRDLYSSLTIGSNLPISTPCASVGDVLAATTTARTGTRTAAPGTSPTVDGETTATGGTGGASSGNSGSNGASGGASAASGHVGVCGFHYSIPNSADRD